MLYLGEHSNIINDPYLLYFLIYSNVTNLHYCYPVLFSATSYPSLPSKAEKDLPQTEVIQVLNSSADFPACYNFTWSQDELSLPCEMIANLDTTLSYPDTTSLIPPSPPFTSSSAATEHSHV